MVVTVTYRDLMDRNWLLACEVLGLSEWCVNEGRVDSSDKIHLTHEQAYKLGFTNLRPSSSHDECGGSFT